MVAAPPIRSDSPESLIRTEANYLVSRGCSQLHDLPLRIDGLPVVRMQDLPWFRDDVSHSLTQVQAVPVQLTGSVTTINKASSVTTSPSRTVRTISEGT